MRTFGFLLLLFIALPGYAQQTKSTKALLYYIARQPIVKTGKPPLLILMHGVGSNEQDLFSFANQLPPQFLVVSARGPYTLGKDSYGWYHLDFSSGKRVSNMEQAEKSRITILRFIDKLKTLESFDANRVYLCGFSQGAIMSYSAGLTRPDKIKGIAVMSGRLPDDIKPKVKQTAQLKKLEVFISHGTKDPVLEIAGAREAKTYLEQLGIAPAYKEYSDVHAINREMLTDLIVWLRKK
ncbi:MAG: phospholipase/Carboxylesterase [Flavipsychrobacter sp.]|nr:phospholipase/Carboxylesterase [Flavipsychrobacter sp.]